MIIIIIIIITSPTTARQLFVLFFFNYIKSYTVSIVPFCVWYGNV